MDTFTKIVLWIGGICFGLGIVLTTLGIVYSSQSGSNNTTSQTSHAVVSSHVPDTTDDDDSHFVYVPDVVVFR